MAKVKVEKGPYLNPTKSYMKTDKRFNEDGELVDTEVEVFGVEEMGYRHPVTHQIIFDDADEVEVEVATPPEPVEPETVEVEVPDELAP